MHLVTRLVLLTVLGFAGPTLAYNSIAGVRDGQTRFTGGLLLQDSEYESDAGNQDFEVEGQILTLGVKSGLNRSFALGAGVGLMLDGELGQPATVGDGEGYRLFVDADVELTRFQGNTLLASFGLTHDRFSFEEGLERELTVTEIKVGALMLRRIQSLSLYGGLDLILASDGEVEIPALNQAVEVERNGRLNMRLGLAFALSPSVDLRADLHLITEQSLLFAADFRL